MFISRKMQLHNLSIFYFFPFFLVAALAFLDPEYGSVHQFKITVDLVRCFTIGAVFPSSGVLIKNLNAILQNLCVMAAFLIGEFAINGLKF
jgi:hypothetical protein